MKKKLLIAGVLLVLALLPDKVTCGTRASDFTCAEPPIPPQTEAIYYYEVQPAIVSLMEMITQSNIQLYYSSGEQ